MVCMPSTNTRIIFTKCNVQHPMDLIFNAPMRSDSRGKSVNLLLKTHNVIACLLGFFLPNCAFRLNHPDTVEAFPFPFWVQMCNRILIINHPMPSGLDPPMPFLHGFISMSLDLGQRTCQNTGKDLLHSFAQRPVIVFESQDKVSIIIYNLFSNSFLYPHCINSNNTA